ncbi:hypothetical protein CGLO_13783 [Colletotrichum gloeosporioides Cg-14]|uniref:Uncharacterized protein n=1 Tax=Colletotrichum gloeosporioides (strain Cg-14) TaxID=1237896 RepID=T0LFR3_COLGC|nr:hypothetical protein CGLO_13783 [Colletotrichum gloeosporioides Cg-14]
MVTLNVYSCTTCKVNTRIEFENRKDDNPRNVFSVVS